MFWRGAHDFDVDQLFFIDMINTTFNIGDLFCMTCCNSFRMLLWHKPCVLVRMFFLNMFIWWINFERTNVCYNFTWFQMNPYVDTIKVHVWFIRKHPDQVGYQAIWAVQLKLTTAQGRHPDIRNVLIVVVCGYLENRQRFVVIAAA